GALDRAPGIEIKSYPLPGLRPTFPRTRGKGSSTLPPLTGEAAPQGLKRPALDLDLDLDPPPHPSTQPLHQRLHIRPYIHRRHVHLQRLVAGREFELIRIDRHAGTDLQHRIADDAAVPVANAAQADRRCPAARLVLHLRMQFGDTRAESFADLGEPREPAFRA